jgi:hypothetical protein
LPCSVPHRCSWWQVTVKQHDGKDDETVVRIDSSDSSKVFISGVCSLQRMGSLYRMCSLSSSVPPRYRYLYAAAAVLVCVCLCVCTFACVVTHLQVSLYVTNQKNKHTKKSPTSNPQLKKKRLHVHLWLTIHAKAEKALEFRRHLTPNPKP